MGKVGKVGDDLENETDCYRAFDLPLLVSNSLSYQSESEHQCADWERKGERSCERDPDRVHMGREDGRGP